MITVHSAAIFVFVGVDSNHFRYVRDFEVVVQAFVGDVPGGTADHSEHYRQIKSKFLTGPRTLSSPDRTWAVAHHFLCRNICVTKLTASL